MPRTVAPDLDVMEHEIDATTIALEIDPHAAPFVGATQGFDDDLPALRARGRTLAKDRLRIRLKRDHINRTIDPLCLDFAGDLRHRVKGDRNHPDFKLHFSQAPSLFIRQEFNDQIREIKRWIVLDHPALAPYKAAFIQAVTDADALTVWEAELARATLALKADIEAAATALTTRRDALHRRLGDHAEANGLERSWADGFFLRG